MRADLSEKNRQEMVERWRAKANDLPVDSYLRKKFEKAATAKSLKRTLNHGEHYDHNAFCAIALWS